MKTVNALFVVAFAFMITSGAKAHYNYNLDGPFAIIKIFKVNGGCVTCKNRIETTVKNLSGIWFSGWDIDSKTLVVKYDRTTLRPDKIELHIGAAGHDMEQFKAPDNV